MSTLNFFSITVQKLLVVVYFMKSQLVYSALLCVYLIFPEHISSARDV